MVQYCVCKKSGTYPDKIRIYTEMFFFKIEGEYMMYSNYKNLKRYAAFLFMVFTVLSGSSERLDTDSIVQLGRKTIIDIISTNKLLLQDIRVSSDQLVKKNVTNNESFREFLDNWTENTVSYSISALVMLLILLPICINYLLLQKNIWKNAVF